MKTKILCFVLSTSLFLGFFRNVIAESTAITTLNLSKLTYATSEASFWPIVSFTEKSIVKGKIKRYFEDVPEMVAIAECESGFRQFDSDGNPLRSPTNDFGAMQINRKVWHKKSIELGYDYQNDLDDNLKMARYVYEQQGLDAWVCAKKVL